MKNMLLLVALVGPAALAAACGGEESSRWPADQAYELSAQFHVRDDTTDESLPPLPEFRVDEKFALKIEGYGDHKPFVIWGREYAQPDFTSFERRNEDIEVRFLTDFIVLVSPFGGCGLHDTDGLRSFPVDLLLEEDGSVQGTTGEQLYPCNGRTVFVKFDFTGSRI